jgi:hypothetical protein
VTFARILNERKPLEKTIIAVQNEALFGLTQEEEKSWKNNEPDFTKRIVTPLRENANKRKSNSTCWLLRLEMIVHARFDPDKSANHWEGRD